DGNRKWQFIAGDNVYSSPAIGPDNTVYVGSLDNYLYAIEGETPLADTPWPMYQHDLQHTGRKD
ncbi:MAG: PQQ-binding-like beta-propeller repeat protein, partial [Bacteroidales bacterium]|nr:PQQ-binding-like beta-propeller repeat protein [Bacteroidales bacterium]